MKRYRFLILCFSIFVVTLLFVVIGKTTTVDQNISQAVRFFMPSWWSAFLHGVTNLMEGYSFALLLFLLDVVLWIHHNKKEAIMITITSILGAFLVFLCKAFVKRVRPHLFPFLAISGYSFPSGHATLAVIFYGSFMFLNHRYLKGPKVVIFNIFLFLLILLTGFSRIYLGAHYFSDVMAGFALGTFLLFGMILCFAKKKDYSRIKK